MKWLLRCLPHRKYLKPLVNTAFSVLTETGIVRPLSGCQSFGNEMTSHCLNLPFTGKRIDISHISSF